MKKTLNITLILLLSFTLSSCATLIKGSTQDIPVDSSPQGAEVFIDGVSYGTTPLTLKLESDQIYEVVLRQNGEERTVMLTNDIGTTWIILDVLAGVAPLIVDYATGDWYELEPGEIFVSF